MTGDLDRAVIRAAVLKCLSDQVNAAFKDAKNEVAEALGAEGRKNAVIDGNKLASVSVTKTGRITVDEAVLLNWVRANYPTEVERVDRVRPAFLEAIKSASAVQGEPASPTGEVDVPGVMMGDPYPLVRKAHGADELVAEYWRTGRLTVTGELKELE